MDPIAIPKSLPSPGAFWKFNREERNFVAILFALLTTPGNLETFAQRLNWHPVDLADAEVSVEWTYLRDLWNHYSSAKGRDNAQLRSAILDCMQPESYAGLKDCSVLEFNTYFGAVP